jgi:Rod binding domain-containing protein
MEINSVSRGIDPSELSLDRLAVSSKVPEAEKIAVVSRHFEAILLRQFLTEAHKPILKQKDSPLGASNGIYQDMIVTQLADEISKKAMFGLASSFQSQMVQRSPESTEDGQRDAPIK